MEDDKDVEGGGFAEGPWFVAAFGIQLVEDRDRSSVD